MSNNTSPKRERADHTASVQRKQGNENVGTRRGWEDRLLDWFIVKSLACASGLY
jgi:hypothetical protein